MGNSGKTGAIVLAAGEATRFGKAKQLLVWEGKTLVGRAVEACFEAFCDPVIVVTGAYQTELEEALKFYTLDQRLILAHNPDFNQGLGSSIQVGLNALFASQADLHAVLIVLADQPRVDAKFLRKLIELTQDHEAAALGDPSGPGVPACFGESLFTRLLNMDGQGAKAILRDPKVSTAILKDDAKRLDIDTFEDWNEFTRTGDIPKP